MERKPYSAGAVKFSFWFMEFRKTVQLLSEGKSFADIKKLYDDGLVGTNAFRSAVQMMTNEDLSTANIDKLISEMTLEEKAGLCSGTENCWAVNAKASEKDQKATLDFMNWLVTSDEGTKVMAEQFGAIPYKKAADSGNVFLKNANDLLEAGNYNVDWSFNYTPNVDEWRASLVAAMNKYDAGGSWDDVKTAFVQGWATQYKAANK